MGRPTRLEPGQLATLSRNVDGTSISVTCTPGMASDRNPEVTRITRADVALVLAIPGRGPLNAARDEVLVLANDRLGWCSAAGLAPVTDPG